MLCVCILFVCIVPRDTGYVSSVGDVFILKKVVPSDSFLKVGVGWMRKSQWEKEIFSMAYL